MLLRCAWSGCFVLMYKDSAGSIGNLDPGAGVGALDMNFAVTSAHQMSLLD
jgi:hypothetical protein